ncbi:TIR domain-containing protein [Aliarcobacter cryaerophilus]|uniref:TIR domain-containing protein n=1 Tax=Aliarcobacter cryaerophilus TaxID=28198 RepID=A0AA46N3Q2_9BACT|nr:hypothetical protein [Aliarcobacter cryaerophilus]UYF42693.1 hypothetical protein NGX11_07205 [Aliarcobacter cryaerophilus]
MSIRICIVFHKESKECQEESNKIFKELYRDFNNPIKKGLMIDTYFLKADDSLDIKLQYYNFYIFLVDDYLVSKSDLKNVDYNISLFISYTENITSLRGFDNSKLYLNSEKDNLELGLFTFLTEKLYEKNKLTLFLSHTKRDSIGEKKAKDYATYLQENTKLKSFIDINDISYSSDIKEEIDKNLENSIFVGFDSDGYSDSKWTQYEIVEAKERNIPIILIDCIEKKVERRFPYLGNSLILSNNTMQENLKFILIEAVRLKINQNKMFSFKSLYNHSNIKFLNNVPELLDIQKIKEEIIIYPEPPITDIEQIILEKTGKKIYTPLTFSCQKNLNKNIGVSISEINGTFDNGFENIHLYTAQEEISKYLLYTKNKIVYGGDISYKSEFNFVKILAEIADSYGNRDVPIINHVCYPLDKNIDINIKAKYKTIIEFKEFNELEVNHDDEIMPYSHLESLISFSKNLSLMRKMMAKNTDARIMLGGKHTGYLGKYPGLLEEAYYTLKEEKPLFLIGGFGGISKLIIDLRKGLEVKELTFEWQKEDKNNDNFRSLLENGIEVDYDEILKIIKTSKLNDLPEEDNDKLFYSTSIEEIVFYIMKGLKNE